MSNEKHPVEQIAEASGGKITDAGALPDGSGYAVISIPLSKDHWIYGGEPGEPPPAPFRVGVGDKVIIRCGDSEFEQLTRGQLADRIRSAGRYAVRAATTRGTDMDFDPDALLQNLIVGMLGYWTEDGYSHL